MVETSVAKTLADTEVRRDNVLERPKAGVAGLACRVWFFVAHPPLGSLTCLELTRMRRFVGVVLGQQETEMMACVHPHELPPIIDLEIIQERIVLQ